MFPKDGALGAARARVRDACAAGPCFETGLPVDALVAFGTAVGDCWC